MDNNGHGTCVATANIESNPIYALKVCSDRPHGGDVCNDWKFTGR
ncbi:hypothetical protein [Streptomyces sp. H39-S7]|nr:hypothetical protein [Streptomyces sp. H39-S7]MCZ4124753.1 hypothetical protein [Streptomyces sp. H39-S7]